MGSICHKSARVCAFTIERTAHYCNHTDINPSLMLQPELLSDPCRYLKKIFIPSDQSALWCKNLLFDCIKYVMYFLYIYFTIYRNKYYVHLRDACELMASVSQNRTAELLGSTGLHAIWECACKWISMLWSQKTKTTGFAVSRTLPTLNNMRNHLWFPFL